MSCCGKGFCTFRFPDGPPLTDYSVSNLNAHYLFLPYGTLLKSGEVVRIWMESGQTKEVIVDEKWLITFDQQGAHAAQRDKELPWQLVAMDTGFEYEDIMDWPNHDLFNPQAQPVVLEFRHPIEVKLGLKMRLLQLLYKIRNL
ncbi:hypothetical protein P8S54_07835 [Thiomicrospira sp. R3]|uniref:hypothetical protein n=1 Tax=Thiomicrospira sp. R3 TaxID=3035472 RepID=UPI00259B956C|nr:hypothetical protein [Thiomicrospira sp. R3]WFE68127.1 hypothetical protein P8S54_07835 [Thiomicrospira sp. R3]